MALPAQSRLSYDDYLGLERSSNVRHEFLDGVAVAMAGGTIRHSALKTDLASAVTRQLEGSTCRPYDSDCKVHVLATGLYSYPDLSVVCGPPETAPQDANALTNPVVLAEVLSPGTEAWDRGGKFENYRTIASLRHYLLVRVDVPRIEHFQRTGDGSWALTTLGDREVLHLADIGLHLDVTALYSNLPPVTDADLPKFPLTVEAARAALSDRE